MQLISTEFIGCNDSHLSRSQAFFSLQAKKSLAVGEVAVSAAGEGLLLSTHHKKPPPGPESPTSPAARGEVT